MSKSGVRNFGSIQRAALWVSSAASGERRAADDLMYYDLLLPPNPPPSHPLFQMTHTLQPAPHHPTLYTTAAKVSTAIQTLHGVRRGGRPALQTHVSQYKSGAHCHRLPCVCGSRCISRSATLQTPEGMSPSRTSQHWFWPPTMVMKATVRREKCCSLAQLWRCFHSCTQLCRQYLKCALTKTVEKSATLHQNPPGCLGFNRLDRARKRRTAGALVTELSTRPTSIRLPSCSPYSFSFERGRLLARIGRRDQSIPTSFLDNSPRS